MSTISVDKKENTIYLTVEHNGEVTEHSIEITKEYDNTKYFIFQWLAKNSKHILYGLPCEVKIKCPENCAEYLNEPLSMLGGIFENTGNAIARYSHLRDCGKHHKSILFWNVADDARYKGFYHKLSKHVDSHYINYVPGFDRKLRKWTNSDIPMTVEAFVNCLKGNDIKKIVTVNYYVNDKYVEKTGVSLVALCNYFDIEWVILDNDPPDLRATGFLHRVWSHNGNQAISNLSILNKYWDNKYELDAIYTAIPQDYSERKPFELNNNYKIIILTNSRLDAVKACVTQIEYLMQRMPPETIFTDIHKWYLATRHIMLNEKNLGEYDLLFYNSMLHRFYYHCVNYLKYYIIQNLKTDRPIELYGDVGFKELFPQYYKGVLYNDEIEELYSKHDQLYLLVNCSMTYLDASGPVYDVVARQVPWINVPVMTRTSPFDGLKNLEYDTIDKLNLLVNDYFVIKPYGYNGSLKNYRQLLNDSNNKTIGFINGSDMQSGNLWNKELEEHQKLIDKTISEYIINNKHLLDNTTRTFFNL